MYLGISLSGYDAPPCEALDLSKANGKIYFYLSLGTLQKLSSIV